MRTCESVGESRWKQKHFDRSICQRLKAVCTNYRCFCMTWREDQTALCLSFQVDREYLLWMIAPACAVPFERL